jgi:hypothetical protein
MLVCSLLLPPRLGLLGERALLTVFFLSLQNKPMGLLVLTLICKSMWARSRWLC